MPKRSILSNVIILAIILVGAGVLSHRTSEHTNNAGNKKVNNIVNSPIKKLKTKGSKNNEVFSKAKKKDLALAKNKKLVKRCVIVNEHNVVKFNESDYIANLAYAINFGDELAIQTVIEAIAGCPSCLERMIEVLNDSSCDDRFRKYAAEALIKSGIREGVLAVLKAIVDAYFQGQHDFKEGLMQVLADVDSMEAANALVGVLLGEDPSYYKLVEMPEDVRHAIAKAIKNISESEAVGELLTHRYKSATTTGDRNEILHINHPVMNALLAADAYQEGDIDKTNKFVSRIFEIENSTALEGMMHLARESSMPLEDVASLAYQWAKENPNTQNHDILVEYISNFNSTPAERAVAASALAAAKDSDVATYALQKSYSYEDDPLVRSYIEAALTVIKSKSEF